MSGQRVPLPRVSLLPTSASGTGTARTAVARMAAGERVLVAVWCRSVGTTWTVELRDLGADETTLGTLVDWISSGEPTSQPEPNALVARELLADCGLSLYPDPTAGPYTSTRHSIGYVSATEVDGGR